MKKTAHSRKLPPKRQMILFVDDESTWLEVVRGVLRDEPFKLITASSGEDALAKVKGRTPDLILSDVRMPAMNGFELFEKIRENPKLASIPFVFMSSLNDYDAMRVAKELGADGYVEKPFDSAKVKSVVTSLLARFEKP